MPTQNQTLSPHAPGKLPETRSVNSIPQAKLGELTIDQLSPQQEGIITRLPDNSLLPFLGLRPGKKLKLVSRQLFGGPLVVETEGRSIALSRPLAQQINVKHPAYSSPVVEVNG